MRPTAPAGTSEVGGGTGTLPAERVRRPPVAWVPVTAVAMAVGVLLVVTSARYGYHRDELYFRLLGQEPGVGLRRPAAGDPAARPVDGRDPGRSPVGAAAARRLGPRGTAILTALLGRELGGGRGAQVTGRRSERDPVPPDLRPCPAHGHPGPGPDLGDPALRGPGPAPRPTLVAGRRAPRRPVAVQQEPDRADPGVDRHRGRTGRATAGPVVAVAARRRGSRADRRRSRTLPTRSPTTGRSWRWHGRSSGTRATSRGSCSSPCRLPWSACS